MEQPRGYFFAQEHKNRLLKWLQRRSTRDVGAGHAYFIINHEYKNEHREVDMNNEKPHERKVLLLLIVTRPQ